MWTKASALRGPICLVAGSLVGLLTGCGGGWSGLTAQSPPPSVERMVSWMPTDSETLIAVTKPVTIAAARPDAPAPTGIQALLWQSQLAPLFQIRQGKMMDLIVGRKLLRCVEGSRRFVRSGGIGLFPYEGCHLLVFEKSIVSFLEELEGWQPSVKVIRGRRVLVFRHVTPQGGDVWRIHITAIRSDLLVCAIDEGVLREVLRRSDEGGAGRALPTHLPEWRYLDRGKAFWAVRHFDVTRADRDPTLPQAKWNPFGPHDGGAVGVAMAYDPATDGQTLTMTYLSRNGGIGNALAAHWLKVSRGMCEVRPRAPGAHDVCVKAAAPAMFWTILLMQFGHGIAI